jgi:hypothetical protein
MTESTVKSVNTKKLQQLLFALLSLHPDKFLPNIFPAHGDDPQFYNDRFLAVELLDTDLQRVGLVIWDDKKELLHGPYLVKPEHLKDQINYLPDMPGKITSASGYLVLQEYKWTSGAKLYAYFEANPVNTADYEISGLDSEKVLFEEC